MPTPKKLLQLCQHFQRNLDAYKQGRYKEAQLRSEFIDPLFKLLGWDMANEQGSAEAYKEVIHEDAIKIGLGTEAPDYCFRTGGVRKFFMEAKKPSIDIKGDVHPAYQLRRYAWSAKLPLSILTDFEELAVYDCRVKPGKADKPATARILYLNYQEYPQKWDELSAIFSPEAIRKGSFDKYVEEKKKMRGTAEVDSAFLEEIERWRDLLARSIALRNPRLSQRELNFAIQRSIDRIIFLRICEDRGIEPYGQLMALQNGEHVYRRLMELFRRADDRYNSGLFHFEHEDGRPDESIDPIASDLVIDDKVLKDIFKNLYYPDSPYEFSVLPADILGQVYEQFLGKVIRLTPGHRAVVEDKPEVRKAGGVYYTPTYIVDYIVRQTVGKLLEGKKPGPRSPANDLRILDPACGSGSFLLGAYQYLLNWHRDQYIADDPKKWSRGRAPKLFRAASGEWKLTTEERKRILLSNIYGVDIDPQAVEVTKLSLLLKVLEGEDEQTITRQLALFQRRALPDLGSNIKCGNSLIGPDFWSGKQMSLMDDEEVLRINAFDWQAEFPEILKAGGFDAVIGNPPYVIITEETHSAAEADYLKKYEVSQYKTDLFHLFLQRAVTVLRKGGQLGYIVPNPWLTLKFASNLRWYLLNMTKIIELVIFDHPVFKDADVDTSLIFIQRGEAGPNHKTIIRNTKSALDVESISLTEKYQILQQKWRENKDARFETRLIGKTGDLILKIFNNNKPLFKVARASLGCQAYNRSKHTLEQIKNRVFHAPRKASKEYLPELAGKDVGRYYIHRKKGEWIKYGPWLHDYRTLDWLQGPRILIREIPGKPPHFIQACYVEETYCNYKTILNVNPSKTTNLSMQYLCGLLNSKLFSIIYPYTSNKLIARSFPRLSVGDLRKLPVRIIDFSIRPDKLLHDRMVSLVELMLDLHKKLIKSNTPQLKTTLERQIEATDRQIDQLVYELYGLTEKEIDIVEEGVG